MQVQKGFTLIEVLIVVAILAVISAVSIGAFVALQKTSDVTAATQEFANVLRLAQNKTVTSENDSQYGVYIDTAATPHRYILFRGASYATRVTAADQIFILPSTTEFSGVHISGGEVVFSKLTGAASVAGDVSVQYKTDTSQIQTVYITAAGNIDFSAPSTAQDAARVKDSRHVHVDYSRTINTSNENVVLTFDNGVATQTIPITLHMNDGQIDWSGTVTVGGVEQEVSVRTHRLNSTDTQFSIHRDGRYNNTILRVSLSGDTSGYLLQYSADGLTTTKTSIYASNIAWQ